MDTKNEHFIQAWSDVLAGIQCSTATSCLVDALDDGDYRFITADMKKILRVYKGAGNTTTQPLLEEPTATVQYYPEKQVPRVPAVAIAAGSSIYVYRNLRPYLKLSIPYVPDTSNSSEHVKEAVDADPDHDMKTQGLNAIATCMSSIYRDLVGEKESSSLIVGTEAKQVLFFDSSTRNVERCITLPSVPVAIAVRGSVGAVFRVHVACRNGIVYTIKNYDLLSKQISVNSPVVAITNTRRKLVIASMDSTVHFFHENGNKESSVVLPSPISAMCNAFILKGHALDCVAVGTVNGSIYFLERGHILSHLQLGSGIASLSFGNYTREKNVLVTVTQEGSIHFHMVRRTAEMLTPLSSNRSKNAPPLQLPKKTKLFLDQTQREIDSSASILRDFQNDMIRLKLYAINSYIEQVTGLNENVDINKSRDIRVQCTVTGLGPVFQLDVSIMQSGNTALTNLILMCTFDSSHFLLDEDVFDIPALIPHVSSNILLPITNINQMGNPGIVKILLYEQDECSELNLINTTLVNMPPSSFFAN